MYPNAYVIHADAGPPSEEIALAAAWARSECDTEEDLAMDEPGVLFYPGILGTGPPLSVGSGNRLRELRDGCGKCSPGRWGLSDRNFPTTDSWERVSGLIWQAVSDWSSNTLLRDLAQCTIIASPFAPLKVDAPEGGARRARGVPGRTAEIAS